MRLTRVVNGNRLVETHDWLALKHAKVYCLLKTLLDEVVHYSKYFHSHRYRPVHLSVQSTSKAKRTFEPRTRYCHMLLACTSVRYERNMRVLIIRK